MKRTLAWLAGDRGNVTPIIAVMLVPIIGAFAVATETSTWFMVQRSEQAAADSAAVAAATNNSGITSPGTSASEAKAVAARYGYVDGVNNVTVTVTMPSCPAPYTGGNCYKVNISKNLPIRLARLVGYSGDVAMGTGRAKTVAANGMARAGAKGTYCITALGTASDAITFKGAPSLNLTGCDIASAGGSSCNGHSGDTIGHSYVFNAGDGNNCGSEVISPKPADIYASLASKIPTSSPCVTGIPVNIPAGTVISAPQTYPCGAKLLGDVTVTSDVTMVMRDGDFDVQGFKISTTGSGHLTLIFAGDSAHSHIFTGSGTFDFAAPTSGDWSGVAIYYDPAITGSTIDIGDVGNSPTYKVTGLLYMPNSNIVVKGAIDHKTGGDNCMSMVVKTLDLRGTGGIFSTPTSECDRAGLVLQGPPGSGATPLLIQ